MSWINGHWYITQEAIRTLAEDCPSNPLVRALERESPQANSVYRDLMDILNRNQWRNSAQRNHFMRRFRDQSVSEDGTMGEDLRTQMCNCPAWRCLGGDSDELGCVDGI